MSVVHRDKIVQNVGRAGGAQPFRADVVLDGAGNARQGFDCLAGGDHGVHFGSLGQGVFPVQGHVGVNFFFHLVDAVVNRFGQLHGAELFILQLFMQFMNGALI